MYLLIILWPHEGSTLQLHKYNFQVKLVKCSLLQSFVYLNISSTCALGHWLPLHPPPMCVCFQFLGFEWMGLRLTVTVRYSCLVTYLAHFPSNSLLAVHCYLMRQKAKPFAAGFLDRTRVWGVSNRICSTISTAALAAFIWDSSLLRVLAGWCDM